MCLSLLYLYPSHPPFHLLSPHLSPSRQFLLFSVNLNASVSDRQFIYMADAQRNRSSVISRRQSTRLQSRAPSSLQINRAVEWNVAIPLLSPLASSPPPPPLPVKREEPPQQQRRQSDPEKIVFKKWQHPAAPFCCETASVIRPFC